jgi:hypothetical protein
MPTVALGTSSFLAPTLPAYRPHPLPGYSLGTAKSNTLVLTVVDRKTWLSFLRGSLKFDVILSSIRRECKKYGGVQDLRVPRPSHDPTEDNLNPELGQIIVKYDSMEAATSAFLVFQNSGLPGHRVV